MTRVIIDNNLWISFLIGKKLSALEPILDSDDIVVYVCEELVDEFISVSSRTKIRKYVSDYDVEYAIQVMNDFCVYEKITEVAESPIRDPKDLYLLSLAETVEADFILTGDKDLLVLGSHKGTRILTFNEFLASR